MMAEETTDQCVQVQFLSNVDLRRLQGDVNRILAMGPAEDVIDVKLVIAELGGRPTYTAMILIRTARPTTIE